MAIVKFYGDLKQFGDKFRMNTETAAEALNGVCCQIDGLRKKIMDGWFRVRINGEDMNEDNLKYGLHSRIPQNAVIHIVPHVAGSKAGIFNIIAGAVLVVIGIIGNIYGGWGTPFIAAGIGLMVGGIAQLLTKLPKTDKDEGLAKKNSSFSSLDNTIAQGAPVPLMFGEMKVGSKTLSQGLETLDG